ncbi:biogenesis of lysosome-related organelles complex 1 subunit 6 [Xyrichtys novacula]|uniref:Biogenesis of lysosome-related organelles complex 1 subunit 6 n=1 Tax=Xyrichtys novacula TaxID=13765 RepID=A0AAV1EKS9_XYRNO|nr:biogenesis of lysosome-related organelles complex 1 subunit 6 [Xyrichtys novacula]
MEEEEMGDEGPSSQSELPHSEDPELAQQDPLPVESSPPEENVFVDKKAVDKLTEGLLSHYLPDLQNSKRALQELTQNQLVLLDTLDQEVTKFRECNALLDLNSLFTEAKVYHNKLVNIRKEMIMLHEKTTKLKCRSLTCFHSRIEIILKNIFVSLVVVIKVLQKDCNQYFCFCRLHVLEM